MFKFPDQIWLKKVFWGQNIEKIILGHCKTVYQVLGHSGSQREYFESLWVMVAQCGSLWIIVTHGGSQYGLAQSIFKKNISYVMFYQLVNFFVWLPCFLEILGNMYIVIICFLVFGFINSEMNLNSLIKAFPYVIKRQDKDLNILRTKRTFNMELKTFFITFKWLPTKQIKKNFFGKGRFCLDDFSKILQLMF